MIQTDKPQAFYIIFLVLYDTFYLTLCVNFPVWFSHFDLYTDNAIRNTFSIFSICMKLELFFLSFFPTSLPFLYFLCFLSFLLPSFLPSFLPSWPSPLWKKVLTSSNNLSILQLLLLIAIKLITLFLLLFITIKTFSNPTVTLLTYIAFVYRAKKKKK